MNEKTESRKSLPFFGVPKLFPYVKKYKPHLLFMVALGLLVTGIEVAMPPQNEPWGVREMHVRHPDGHMFRVSTGIPCDESSKAEASQ